VLNDLDVVQRDEFEAVKAMAAKALEENERLSKRIEALEAAAGVSPEPETPPRIA
jgi:BMFP domain-containing protein YqiC